MSILLKVEAAEALRKAGATEEQLKHVAEAHDWFVLNDRMYASTVVGHPRFGALAKDVRTDTIKFFDRDLRVVLTKNTVYYLHKELM